MMHMIGGSAAAIPTPFKDGRIDAMALAQLCECHAASGTSAIIVCGSTGEAASLSPAEHAEAIRIVVEASDRRVPVIAGCTASSTEASVALAWGAVSAGAEGLLCAAPPYTKPTQAGIMAHMQSLTATGLPLMLYDVPQRSAISIQDTTIAKLFEAGTIQAIKDASGDLARPPRLAELCGAGLRQMSGDDAIAAGYRAMGGHGCISVTANVTPRLCARLHAAWDAGDLTRFGSLRDLLNPLHLALFAETNPILLKAALCHIGLCAGTVRLPLTLAEAPAAEHLQAILDHVMPAEHAACQRPARLH